MVITEITTVSYCIMNICDSDYYTQYYNIDRNNNNNDNIGFSTRYKVKSRSFLPVQVIHCFFKST